MRANPFDGIPDSPSPALPLSPIAPGDSVVLLRGCTLAHYKLMSNGMGFDVHFTVPLNENEKLPALTTALQRMVDINVTRYNRDEDPNVADLENIYEKYLPLANKAVRKGKRVKLPLAEYTKLCVELGRLLYPFTVLVGPWGGVMFLGAEFVPHG